MERDVGHLPKDPRKAVDALIWFKVSNSVCFGDKKQDCYVAQVVGIGNTGVGKTCLIKHFCESKFTSGYQPTVGVDYGFKIHNVFGKEVRVHLWDLSGGHEYNDVRNELYVGTDAVFLVYDVTDQASFDSLDVWMRELKKYGAGKAFACLVANKVDLKSKRIIPTSDGRRWATNNNINFYETSCVTGDNIVNFFSDLLEGVVKKNSSNMTADQAELSSSQPNE
ncbi:hypothetical protein LSH36_202g08001 [Paralvinella palmiformis]|uniref:Uncharacterized protein n=1 Tax=Paralvinella palmiformis TaxID=53620 RepID=A0AAD9N7G1_9ANNE|nr:hypothetical protein LSH36_202g08001 [Paralvinella palmiformis]